MTVNNYTAERVQTRTRRGASGEKEIEVVIGSIVQKQLASGALDRSMAANYGVARRGKRV